MSNPKTPIPTQTPSDYTNTLIKLSVTRILKQTGFNSANSSALQTLTRIATLFLHQITTSAASNAALSGGIPTLHDVVSAIDDLNFPLDFSTPQLSRFITTTSDNRPFLRRISSPPPQNAVVAVKECGGVGRRGPEVPVWLPEFPDMSVVNCDNVSGKEVYWEESVVSLSKAEEKEKEKAVLKSVSKEEADKKRKRKRGMGEFMVFGRRERLKFRLRDTRKAKAKAGNVDDLKLRNGVCRGGKRIGLGKRVNCRISSFFDDDDKRE